MLDLLRDLSIGVGGGGLSSLKKFFGDGSDGVLNTSGNLTYTVTAQTGLALKQYSSITINNGHTVTTDNPCRGIVLYCTGDVILNGIIDMSKKAGYAPGLPPIPFLKTSIDQLYKLFTTIPTTGLIGGAGGNGGAGGTDGGYGGGAGGAGGTGGAGRMCAGGFGGGGGGGSCYNGGGASGGSVIIPELGFGSPGHRGAPIGEGSIGGYPGYNGGGGTGGGYVGSAPGGGWVGSAGFAYGGGGGGGGGARNNGASSGNAGEGEYAGGFVCIIAKGSITIGSTGRIYANGGNGGNGGAAGSYAGGGGGGGGAGGGVVFLCYGVAYANTGSITVNGGNGGSEGGRASTGAAGSVGAITTLKL